MINLFSCYNPNNSAASRGPLCIYQTTIGKWQSPMAQIANGRWRRVQDIAKVVSQRLNGVMADDGSDGGECSGRLGGEFADVGRRMRLCRPNKRKQRGTDRPPLQPYEIRLGFVVCARPRGRGRVLCPSSSKVEELSIFWRGVGNLLRPLKLFIFNQHYFSHTRGENGKHPPVWFISQGCVSLVDDDYF
jgi:hypothetical protein